MNITRAMALRSVVLVALFLGTVIASAPPRRSALRVFFDEKLDLSPR
jgi:hypothetical protein